MADVKRSSKSELSQDQIMKQKELKHRQEKDSEMVRGIFRFHEVPGGQFSFNHRVYKEDQLASYTMKDGEVYTVPLGVARHLNTNCWYPSYNYKNDDNGRPVVSVAEKIRRCSFQSLEFVDLSANSTGSALPTL